MKPEDLLFDLKRLTKDKPEGIPMWAFRPRYKISMMKWRGIMRYLVNNRKIEIYGERQMIRPVSNGMEKVSDSEVRITFGLIKDIVAELNKCKPNDAYKFCLEKYGFCNSESFTRLMRKMVEYGELWRDENGYYSLAPLIEVSR